MERKSNAKNNFIGIEVVFSIMIIIIILFVIVLVVLSMKQKVRQINKNDEANIILTNLLENINSRDFNSFETYINELSTIGISKSIEKNTQTISIDGSQLEDKFLSTSIPSGYNIELIITDDTGFDVLKNIEIVARYKVDRKNYVKRVSTVIEREMIDRCNSPVIAADNFITEEIESDKYSIIPIKYSDVEKRYVKTNLGDEEWYNYSAKEWAKILVLTKEDESLETSFINDDGSVNREIQIGEEMASIDNYMYVWIPNFTVKSGRTYFRYGAGKSTIRLNFKTNDEEEYLFLNEISNSENDLSKEVTFDGVSGVWIKVTDTENEYYKAFNETKYGPMNRY